MYIYIYIYVCCADAAAYMPPMLRPDIIRYSTCCMI